MFSGIVEATGKVEEIEVEGSNYTFSISSSISGDAYIDQSIAHNGVCLTVISQNPYQHKVTAIKETLDKTNLESWKIGELINLERCVNAGQRMDGHFVQGHVDATAKCIHITVLDGSWYFNFEYDEKFSNYLVDKGSICINGVSLTLVKVDKNTFSVAIIPYTFENTNFNKLVVGDLVNVEFDILGKYIIKYMENIQKK